MTVRRKSATYFLVPLFILNTLFCSTVYSQAPSSLFMLNDNFHSQFLNPSYMRSDDAIVVSVAGFAGANVGNSSNFKISDLMYIDNEGTLAIDFEKMYDGRDSKYLIDDWSYLPAVFVDVPIENGRLSFSYRERVESSLSFGMSENNFIKGKGSPATFKTFYSDNINYSGVGYHEFAVGYARQLNDNITFGVRGKIFFGGAFTDVNNWEYGINYTEQGDNIELRHKGAGEMSLPVVFYLSGENLVLAVNSENAVRKYMKSYKNPGLGIDLGATFALSEKDRLSASVRDVGAIWFRDDNTMDIVQDASLVFDNNIYDYIEYDDNNPDGYVDPYQLILDTKDDYPFLYRPRVDTVKTAYGLPVKLALHYQHSIVPELSVGITNQSAFYKNSYLNILSFNAMHKVRGLSVFESVNLYGTKNLTFGAGLQWESRYFQLFALTDNIEAIFQPTRSQSFSMTVGISFLINKPYEKRKKRSSGKFSPYLPFYENKN